MDEQESRRGKSLARGLSTSDNALNFIRLVLAILVIFSHSFPVGGYGSDPAWGGSSLGGWAVAGFFSISGYLVSASRARCTLSAYLWRRSLRIFPAFWVCLIMVAFAFAPLAARLSGDRWRVDGAMTYVLSNALLKINQWGVPDTLTHHELTAWNGSLWTLIYEFLAYLAVGALFVIPVARKASFLGLLLAASIAAGPLAHGPANITTNFFLDGIGLAGFFLAGSFLWALGERLPINGPLALVCLIMVGVLGYFGLASTYGQLPLAYLTLWLGATLRIRVGSRNDISYGVYIYAFPVQQLLFALGMSSRIGPITSALLALGLALPLAFLSWHVVEEPALRLKRFVGNKSRQTTRA